MMFFHTKKNVAGIAALLVAAAMGVAVLLVPRIIAETKNKNLEIALSYSSVSLLARRYNYPLKDLLDRFKSAGATTIILDEETPSLLEKEGVALFFSASDYRRLNLLEIISEGSLIKPGTFVFPSGESRYANYLKKLFEKSYGLSDAHIFKIGSRIFLYTGEKSASYGVISDATPIGFSPDKIEDALSPGFRVALSVPSGYSARAINLPSYIYSRVAAIPTDDKAPAIPYPVALIPSLGDAIPDAYFDKNDSLPTDEMLSKFYYVDVEFSQQGDDGLKWFFGPSHTVKGHRLTDVIVKKRFASDPDGETERYLRAARERGVRFFIVDPDDAKTIDENINRIKHLARSFKKSGLAVSAPAIPIPELYPAVLTLSHSFPPWMVYLKKSLSFIAALIAPPVLLYRFRRWIVAGRKGPAATTVTALKEFIEANILIAAAGILAASFVSSGEFAGGNFEQPSGIKFLLVVPLFLSVAVALYDADEVRNFLITPLRLWHFIAGILALAVVAVIWVRSGNDGGMFTSSLELRARGFLENIFVWARPRWKEILVGQPCLYLALRYSRRDLLIGGAVGVVSVINTFLHIHTPFGISVYRTVAGAIGGLVIGLGISVLYDFYTGKIKRDVVGNNN